MHVKLESSRILSDIIEVVVVVVVVVQDSSADKAMAIIVVFLAISLLVRRVIRRKDQNSISDMIASKDLDTDSDYPDTPRSFVTNERTALMGRQWFPGPSNIQTV